MTDYVEHKTFLTPAEKLRVAHAHLVDGVSQEVIARLMGVNAGRVNEAIQAVRAALSGVMPPGFSNVGLSSPERNA